ncbi:MAG: hypothetical protein AB7E95_10875 [Kiritimatiellales bacterium]
MKKIIIALTVLTALSINAATSNTWVAAGPNDNWSNADNWDVIPADWTDYSADLIFGANDGASYNMNNTISVAKVGSMTFTSDTGNDYWLTSSSSYAVQFANGSDNGGDIIVNNGSHSVTYAVGVLFNYGTSADRYARAVNGDIWFRNVQLWTSNYDSRNLYFQAGNGRTISFRSGYAVSAQGSVAKALTFQGDGTGGLFEVNSSLTGNAIDLYVEDAATATLNMDAGQFRDITLANGRADFSKDNMISADLAFDATGGGENIVAFNGHSNDFELLTITADADVNILDFNGSNTVTFADCSSESWLGQLVITNFESGVDSLRFGTNSTALTSAQLTQITVDGQAGASLDSDGFLVIPEPTTLSLFVISSATLFWVRYNRCR